MRIQRTLTLDERSIRKGVACSLLCTRSSFSTVNQLLAPAIATQQRFILAALSLAVDPNERSGRET